VTGVCNGDDEEFEDEGVDELEESVNLFLLFVEAKGEELGSPRDDDHF
jgi:hypothetical protein